MKYLVNLVLLSLLISCLKSEFFSNVFSQLNKDKKGMNLIISPLSIYQVLSLLANGAEGETLSEMVKILGSNDIMELNNINEKILEESKKFSTLDIANAIMTKCYPPNLFLSYAKLYSADIEILENVEQVNNWCSEKTHGKINKIIERLDPQTVMILLNAIYFKGKWVYHFKKDSNMKLPFYNFGKEEIVVETMIQTETFRYYENSEVQIIELPFKDDFMSAIIILPSEKININQYIETISSKKNYLNELINKLDYAKVQIELPKFEIDFSQELNNVIKELGMEKIFDCGKADLSGLCQDQKNLYVSSILHKTYLKVNEVGTEAAAITAIIVLKTAMMNKDKEIIYEMKVNRPFIFLLKNSRFPEGYNFVFMGKIEKIED